ncbi:hypothetical protein PhaeoP23_03968 (plasmid) [Phaeobacter piscinae]|uniref:Uncharacterized protein n=1 Tax=Phaeobacter piscinae TaxID=1580596 RepID=A0ABM6PK62_9RHOB|nr:hypothetical protein PhaeoP36_04046 [Phaeobacter piscinae]AUQ88642.1 hypothetical protein PhaeoP42_04047 [Phaeobacter piscinae]AUQ92641.1 hypothetical protein PhaeoP24_04083 [Phaeobacter inhibens]AUR26447.1 hypothetical protein PhaeoP23_03968 [Phaeobacter piscinae]
MTRLPFRRTSATSSAIANLTGSPPISIPQTLAVFILRIVHDQLRLTIWAIEFAPFRRHCVTSYVHFDLAHRALKIYRAGTVSFLEPEHLPRPTLNA